MRIKAKLRSPRIDLTKYVKALESKGRETISLAMFEYVTTYLSVIPVWTGASALAIQKVANLVGMPIVVSASPVLANRPGLISSSRAEADATSDGRLEVAGGKFSFTFSTSLPHLVYNEYHDANAEGAPELFSQLINPGPYDFQGQTSQAVQEVFKRFAPPDLAATFTLRRIEVR